MKFVRGRGKEGLWAQVTEMAGGEDYDMLLTTGAYLARQHDRPAWQGVAMATPHHTYSVVCAIGTIDSILAIQNEHGVIKFDRETQFAKRRFFRTNPAPWLNNVRKALDHTNEIVTAGFFGDDTANGWVEWVHVGRRTWILDVWAVPSLTDRELRSVRL